ncbi:MAG: hypothetical protein ACKVQC_02455, partial [Elusimicrobiota bacterium]
HEPEDKKYSARVGCEYNVMNTVSLRTGYLTSKINSFTSSSELSTVDKWQGFVGGFGLKIQRFQFDYAFAPFGVFGQTHRFTVSIKK